MFAKFRFIIREQLSSPYRSFQFPLVALYSFKPVQHLISGGSCLPRAVAVLTYRYENLYSPLNAV